MTETFEAVVHYSQNDEIAVVTIDAPPVNAMGVAVRAGLHKALSRAFAEPSVKAVVLIGANDKFIAGIDIKEFGGPRNGVKLSDLQALIEQADKPVVAAIDGFALGGGLELALAVPFRISAARARLGLPEVNLGLLPAGGGTQRLTRLLGPEAALDIILSGRHLTAEEALRKGLVDRTVATALLPAALEFARTVVAASTPIRKIIELTDKVSGVDFEIFTAIRKKNESKWRGMVAPYKIVECIEAACRLGPREGLEVERNAFQVCLDAPARAAQVHLFFAERKAAKLPAGDAAARPRPIKSTAVIGAGTMGGGIAMALANAGYEVKILEISQDALDRGLDRVRSNYATSVTRGSTSQATADAALARIKGVLDYGALGDADLVIEAVFEDMALKQETFRKLDAVAKPGAILATNTSTMDIDAIAGATNRPGDVIGLHFFSPAHVMRLLEIIRGTKTSSETVATVMSFAKEIGKMPVLARNSDGFIGNRILKVYGRESEFLLEEGATPWQIDKALQAFGFPMGVFLMRDLAGLDVSWRVRQYRARFRDPNDRYSPVADRICELGRFGQKTGKGYYRYDGRTAVPDPEIEALIEKVSADLGIGRKPISDDEIVTRILTAMVNEGAFILGEGVARRASDIDVVYVHGYGFPKYRGGPMFWAENQGLAKVYETVQGFHARFGKLWRPAPLLAELADSGSGWPTGEES
ncbi:MAG: 3-hydroxyacyl-CoA dehydrogenase [Hydrocarboniphaga sp.]|uniref:3-hydroxyacyl-CoA dehydrogenase NAD-binding domain-containing protein n=1 Tax=Hydrocarboniphaga sp. TaxID=2033016 RepID=UPI002620AE37|nr:3-hydroxyacyl-CoA dehydrogenase NAD-binding domain-containing protein [Hydrocarboniphaga sp.]MDB5968734.1 3-hydroxyacyl-CoA dehydrogenase [Hydrocarboniphaga sp.]